MKFTLKQLEVFQAAAHFENISTAADSLALSQSAASGALQKLERTYGVQLFDRIGKKLQLNEQGKALRAKTQALLEQARALESEFARHDSLGDLKIGATLTIGNYLAVSMVARFMREHPESRVHLEVANTTAIAKRVAQFELDIGLLEGAIRHEDLIVTPWLEDELAVFCSPQHALASRQFVSEEDLLNASWILREPGSGTRQAFDWAMHDLIPRLHVAMELQHTEAIKRAVEAGLGIACLSRVALEDAFARGSLVPLPVPKRNFHRQFYIVMHKNKYRSTGVTKWLELCEQQASESRKGP